MGRVARIVVPGAPHHVTQRGNRRAAVFLSDDDRHEYLRLVGKWAGRHGLELWAYCLMSNHVHFVVVPSRADSLAKAFRDAHTNYAARFNRQQGLSGHLWQGRFFSTVLDDAHLWSAVRYVERNPVRASQVVRAQDYAWSSAAWHCGLRRDPLLAPCPLQEHMDAVAWSAWLTQESDADVEALRRHTHTGRPCGGATFVQALEASLGRFLRPRKRGPQPKPATTAHRPARQRRQKAGCA